MFFSLMTEKQYKSVELPKENKYEVSGKALEEFLAEILFCQYLGEKDSDFLAEHNYSKEEVLDGIKRLAEQQEYSQISSLLMEI